MTKLQRYIKYMVAVYMAIYFVFNAAFVHNHTIDGQNISHSHFFAGKQHTASAAELIFLYNITLSVLADAAQLPACEFAEIITKYIRFTEEAVTGISSVTSLRGPPVL
ncbi:MAG: hypothetical protein J6U83_05445 [Bacteroidales bacterium]|nr:hypothetical protein [Bacteroidales bacterium]